MVTAVLQTVTAVLQMVTAVLQTMTAVLQTMTAGALQMVIFRYRKYIYALVLVVYLGLCIPY